MDGDTPPKQRMMGWRGDLQTTRTLHIDHLLTQALMSVGLKMDGDTPPKQRMVGWRGDLQTTPHIAH